jgi:transposase
MDSLSSLPSVGIDVSKATLAVCYQVHDQVKHLEVSNTKAGFQQLVAACGAHCQFVMEATSTYNLALAYYLHEQGRQIAVLNPLVVIKRFIQMHLSKGKVTARMRSGSCGMVSDKC